jgi:hypothetical protein
MRKKRFMHALGIKPRRNILGMTETTWWLRGRRGVPVLGL